MERSLCGKSGNILDESTSNTASEGSGISRWAVKKLAGMEWPHRILFEPDLRNQGKDRQPGNHKTPGNNKNLRASLFCATEYRAILGTDA